MLVPARHQAAGDGTPAASRRRPTLGRNMPARHRDLDSPSGCRAYCGSSPVACTGGRVPVRSPPECEVPSSTTPRFGRPSPGGSPHPHPHRRSADPPDRHAADCRCPPRVDRARMRPADRRLKRSGTSAGRLAGDTTRAAIGIRRRDLLSASGGADAHQRQRCGARLRGARRCAGAVVWSRADRVPVRCPT